MDRHVIFESPFLVRAFKKTEMFKARKFGAKGIERGKMYLSPASTLFALKFCV
jgi:hypothetical protein